MQAQAMTYPARPNPLPLILFSIAIMLSVAIASHAIAKHGDEALAVQECIKGGGMIQRWENPYNEHKIQVCELPDGRFGFRIMKKDGVRWREITAYIKNRANSLADIERYLQGQGARLEWMR